MATVWSTKTRQFQQPRTKGRERLPLSAAQTLLIISVLFGTAIVCLLGQPQSRLLSPESLTPEVLVALARKTMAGQPGFQGHGLTHEPGTGIFYGARPGQMRLQGPGGRELPPYFLLPDKGIWFSEDGIHWTDNPEAWAGGFPIIIMPQDPRVVLAYALNPHEVARDLLQQRGEEVPEQARVIEVHLDGRRFLQKYFQSTAFLKISLSVELPLDHHPDLEALSRLGYKVPTDKGPEMPVIWLAKDNLWVEFRKTSPPEEGFVHVEAQVQGADRMTSDLENTFQELLAAYGVDPADWALARLDPQRLNVTPTSEMEPALHAYYFWLWIELATGRVARMTLFSPFGITPLTFTYDTPVYLEVPQEALPSWKAKALNEMTESGLQVLGQLVRGYQQKHGRFPETLTPETTQEILEAEKLTWPTNPFTGRPMEEAKQRPGDYTYETTADGKECHLSGYGWDHPAGESYFHPFPLLPPMVVPPHVANPTGIP